MTHAARWPDLTPDQVHARVANMWDLTTNWPLPRFTLVCPLCHHPDVALKDFRFFERKGATIPHRCDVQAKCTRCSHVITFGLAVPPDVYNRHQPGRRYHWRWVRDQIQTPSGGPIGPDQARP